MTGQVGSKILKSVKC